MARPLLLDVDTGVDDAMAIALATCLDSHELVGVTTVAGNVNLDIATDNTPRVLEWLGHLAPVYRGMSRPLVRPLHTATRVHGNDGLGGWAAPAATGRVGEITAPEAILQVARKHRGELDASFVGPLTNLAVALMLEPELAGWFHTVTIMGGAFFNPGNETEHAEFNVFVDPEAAGIVACSGLPATWIGLDVTHQVGLSLDTWTLMAELEVPTAVLAREVSRQSFEERKREQVYLHDPLAVAVLADPGLIETVTGQVLIETGHDARGEARVSRGEGNARVATSVDARSFLEMFSTKLQL